MIDTELITRKTVLIARDLPGLDREFASRIAVCAGLRNRIVHEYNELEFAERGPVEGR